jgi:hypothetical protein
MSKNAPSKRKRRRSSRAQELAGLKATSDALLLRRIRELMALPIHKRTHFLRVRWPNGGSSL